MAKARIWGDWSPENEKGNIAIFCPGCGTQHVLATKKLQSSQPVWAFDGNMDRPTFSPSLLVRTGKYVPGHEDFDDEGLNLSSICHSFIKDGFIQFLGDCTHALKGRTIELPEIDQ